MKGIYKERETWDPRNIKSAGTKQSELNFPFIQTTNHKKQRTCQHFGFQIIHCSTT